MKRLRSMYIYTVMSNLWHSFHCLTMVTSHALATRIGVIMVLAVTIPVAWSKRVPKQVHTKGAVIESEADHNTAESGFGGAGIAGHGKYFQDIYTLQSGPQQLEFGHVCEDPNGWEQRFEKKDLAKQRHQGQVRWGDKHGGYGEQYWDFNHAGHGGDEGGDEGGEGGYSEPVPQYHDHDHDDHNDQRVKRNHQQRQQIRLVFDPATGQVIDEATGQVYQLQALPTP